MEHEEEIDLDGAPIPVLRDLLVHADPRQRGDSACALGDRLRTREIPGLDREIQEAVATLLSDEVFMVRLEAAIALAEAHDRRATDTLIEAMGYRFCRLDAIRALGTLGDPKAIQPLQHIMGRWLSPWADQLQAAAALCALGDPRGAEYLEKKLAARRRAERAAAIHFIGESKHPDALHILGRILAETTDQHRDVAVRALGHLRDPRGAALLDAARQGADAELNTDIDEALAMIERAKGST
jgi:HEAT repeat protein